MKNKLAGLLIALALIVPVKAQQSNNNTAGGAILGGIVGAVIGNQMHHNGAAGAAIGIVTGAIAGNAIDNAKRPQSVIIYRQPAPPAKVIYVENIRPDWTPVIVQYRVWDRGHYRVIHDRGYRDSHGRVYPRPNYRPGFRH